MRRTLRWIAATLAAISAFFATLLVCGLLDVGKDTALQVGGIIVAVACLPFGWWAGRDDPAPQVHGAGASGGPAPLPAGGGADDRSPSRAEEAGIAAEPIVIGEIPRRPPAFRVRADLRAMLAETGGSGRITVVRAVTGARGVGKTHLVAAHARRRIDEGWAVVAWIAAESADQTLAGFDQLAEALGLRDRDDTSELSAAKVRRWLQTKATRGVLVVFDDVGAPEALERWLPVSSRAEVIITSTSRSASDLGMPIDVGVYSLDEAVAFLCERTDSADGAGAKAVAEELGCLPLALGQAAALIRKERIGYGVFLDRLRALPVGEYLREPPGGARHGASQAVLLSLSAVEETDPNVRGLVELIAVLSPAGVERGLLYRASAIGILDVSDSGVDAALGRLNDASLITFDVHGDAVLMHRFTQRVLRDRARHARRLPEILDHAHLLLRRDYPGEPAMAREHRTEAIRLVPHVHALWDSAAPALAEAAGTELAEKLLGLRAWVVWQLRAAAFPDRAIEVGARTFDDYRCVLGADHPGTLASCNDLAGAYREAGLFRQAEKLYEKALDDRLRVLGSDHPDTLTSRSNLANTYKEIGRLDEAVALHAQTLDDRLRLLGSDHPLTLTSRSNLANTYTEIGRLDEAIALHARTLDDRLRVVGSDHPDTLTSRSCLAHAYRRAGRMAVAIDLFERTLADRERALGAEHPETLVSGNNLANAYQEVGRLDEAVAQHERILAARRRVLGPSHPHTLNSHNNLGTAYEAAGRDDQAREAYRRAVAEAERAFGPGHPSLQVFQDNLSRLS